MLAHVTAGDPLKLPYWKLSAFYFFYFALLGTLLPFWGLYLKHQGFSVLEISQLMAILIGTKIIAPNIWGWLADKTGLRLGVIRWGSFLTILCFTGVFFKPDFWGMALLMAGYISISALLAKIPREDSFRARVAWQAFKQAFWALTMPAFVMVGIYAGLFSPTEAGGFACAYAAFLGMAVYRTVTFKSLLEAAVSSAMMTARIMIVVAAAGVISWVLTVEGVPQALVAATADAGLSPLGFLLCVNLLLLAIGCVLDPTSAILVLSPLLVPIAVSLGIDPIHFGIVMTVNLAIGMFTPPFGLNIFVAQSVLGIRTSEIYRGVLPFIGVQVSALALITLVPALSLWLLHGMS